MKDEEIAQAMFDTLVEAGLDKETAIKAVLYCLLHDLFYGYRFHNQSSAKLQVECGFPWDQTPEGHKFWDKIARGI